MEEVERESRNGSGCPDVLAVRVLNYHRTEPLALLTAPLWAVFGFPFSPSSGNVARRTFSDRIGGRGFERDDGLKAIKQAKEESLCLSTTFT